MKASILLLSLFCTACTLLDPPLSFGPRRDPYSGSGASAGSEADSTVAGKDTVFLVSAVSFPESYDWQRDTLFGSVSCTVHLFKGGTELLSFPGGPGTHIGASPDSHHIIGGSLFSVYSDGTGTYVSRDGELISSWPEKEYLLGLLYRDGVLHTLGRAPALTYRIDGEEMLRIESGEPFGSFGLDTYGPGGALYEDDGAVCFAYHLSPGVGNRQAYIVRDGISALVLNSPMVEFVDVKQIEGEPALLYQERGNSSMGWGGRIADISRKGTLRWDSAGIVLLDGEARVVGHYRTLGESGSGSWGVGGGDSCCEIDSEPLFIYCNESHFSALPAASPEIASSYFFTRDCGCLPGASLALALTPRDTLLAPYVSYRGSVTEYPLHGFLSGISYTVE